MSHLATVRSLLSFAEVLNGQATASTHVQLFRLVRLGAEDTATEQPSFTEVLPAPRSNQTATAPRGTVAALDTAAGVRSGSPTPLISSSIQNRAVQNRKPFNFVLCPTQAANQTVTIPALRPARSYLSCRLRVCARPSHRRGPILAAWVNPGPRTQARPLKSCHTCILISPAHGLQTGPALAHILLARPVGCPSHSSGRGPHRGSAA